MICHKCREAADTETYELHAHCPNRPLFFVGDDGKTVAKVENQQQKSLCDCQHRSLMPIS